MKSALRLGSAAALSLAVICGAVAGPVHAQDDPAESQADSQQESQDEQQADYPIYNGRSADGEVDLVVTSLMSIAVFMTVMLGLFLWHTSPRRRLLVARRRADSRIDELRYLIGDGDGGGGR